MTKKIIIGGLATIVALFSFAGFANAAPDGFETEVITGGLFIGVDFEYAPDGRIFVAQKGGAVRVVDATGTLLPTPFITLTDVNDYGDRGLVGIALDPNFSTNGYVYLGYTYENDATNYEGPKTSRVVRVTASGDVAVPGSEVVILGTEGGDSTRPSCTDFPAGTDCMGADDSSHAINSLVFGPDNMLYVSHGDGAAFDVADPLAHRSQDLDILNGKILRINTDGTGATDNPHYNGDVNANRSKVWAQGFRNPFRFSFRPANNSLYLGDVGWYTSEEVNIVEAGGNYGWPCREGLQGPLGGYPVAPSTCAAQSSYDDPLYYYNHPANGSGGSITGGVFYTGTSYPAEYQDTYFFGDFAHNNIKRLEVDSNDNLIAVHDFIDGAGGPVAFGTDLSGNIVYISVYTGELIRIVHTTGNRTPIASASSNITSGDNPLSVFFSSTGSSDPDGDPISFSWDFGDGSPASTDSNPTHTYTTNGTYTAVLTVTDSGGKSDTDSVEITVGNNAPTAVIALPEADSLYIPLSDVNLFGVATDPEDGTITDDAQFSWRILLHHNIHYHVLQQLTGQQPTFIGPDHGSEFDTVWIEVELTVTDSAGLTDTDSIFLYKDENGTPVPFHSNTLVSPVGSLAGTPITVTTTIGNSGDDAPFLVDIELFDSSNQQVAQSFYDNETITPGTTRDFTLDYTPTTDDTYRVAVGLIHTGWQGLYEWTNNALSFAIGSGGGNAAPAITLSGDNPLNLNVGDTFTEPGFTATDTEDGDITGSVVVGGDTVDTSTVGTYNITYDVTDSGGLAAPQQVRTVTVTNVGTWTPTPPNGATYFDGVDDYIDTEFWDIEEPIGFTLEARFAADSFNGDTTFIGKTDGVTGTPQIDWMFGLREVSPTEAELLYIITSGGTQETLTGGSIAVGEFVQASAVYDNTDMILYKNGVEVARTPKTGLIAQDITNQVMVGNLPGNTATHGFHGSFDEVRVWNEPQSAAEIVQFQGELTQKEDGLIKDWRMNEGFGQIVIDRSNSGHHGHLGSVHGGVDGNDPIFLGGVYPAGGTFAPTNGGILATPNPVAPGVPTTITVNVDNTGDGAGFMIVNVEVYDPSGTQVFQQFVDGEGFFAGETRAFDFEFTPTVEGDHRVAVGLVHLFWADVYEWINEATTITVQSGGGNNAPTITLLGDNPLTITVGGTYTDPGATADDFEDGDITGSIVVGGDTVDPNTIGSYNVTYDVTDSGGLSATQRVRVIDVVAAGNSAPSITLLGDNPLNLNLNDTFTEPGFTATDTEDGDITANVIVAGDVVNTAVAGTYVVTYDVTDSGGLGAPQQTRDVVVTDPGAGFTLAYSSASAAPNPTTTGTPVTVTASVTNTGSAGIGVVNLELYSGGVQVHQEIFEDEVFGAGETRNFEFIYTPTTEAVYSLQVGLYEQYWAGFFSWTSDATTFIADNGGGGGATIIYDDSFAPGFANWGWDGTFDLASTAVTPSEGANSIETSFTQPWGGLYIHHDAFDTTGDTNLVFDIHGGATGGQVLQVGALDSGGTLVGQVLISTYATVGAGSWSTATIPLADLNIVDTTITGLIFQGASGAIESTFYLDNVNTQ